MSNPMLELAMSEGHRKKFPKSTAKEVLTAQRKKAERIEEIRKVLAQGGDWTTQALADIFGVTKGAMQKRMADVVACGAAIPTGKHNARTYKLAEGK